MEPAENSNAGVIVDTKGKTKSIRRQEIGLPTDFKHIEHYGPANTKIVIEDMLDVGPQHIHKGSTLKDTNGKLNRETPPSSKNSSRETLETVDSKMQGRTYDKMDSELNAKRVSMIPCLQELDLKKEIGRGSYGAVYEVKFDGLPCIAKGLHDIFLDIQVADSDRQEMRKKFWDECFLLSKLKHPNIVQFLGVYQSKEDAFLVMEYMHMALDVCLKKYPNIPFPFKASIVQDVSIGLLHLHSLNPPIIHRDLTASNVLLTDGMRAKIADLGVSKMFDIQLLHRCSGQTTQPGTPAYMPPEALAQNPSYGLQLDIFSFGALMLFTATQEFPIAYELGVSDITQDAMKNHTIQILKRKCWIDKMGKEHPFQAIVIQCLQDCPEARPTAMFLTEAINNICCKYKNKWKNILELHNDLQKSQAEVEQIRNEAEHVKKQLENDVQQHIFKEEQLRVELENQKLEFLKIQRQSENEDHACIHGSEKPTTKPIPCATIRRHQSVSTLSRSIEPKMDPSVEISVQAEKQESMCQQQRELLSRELDNPYLSHSYDAQVLVPNSDSVQKIPQHPYEKRLSPMSEHESTNAKNPSSPQHKPIGGGAVIPLPLDLMEQEGKDIEKYDCSKVTKPAPKPRQRASTQSRNGPISITRQQALRSTLSHSVELEKVPSVGSCIQAAEIDSSKCIQQKQLLKDLDFTSVVQSWDAQSDKTSVTNLHVPQIISSIMAETSSKFSTSQSTLQRKPTGGVAVIPLQLSQIEIEHQDNLIPSLKLLPLVKLKPSLTPEPTS